MSRWEGTVRVFVRRVSSYNQWYFIPKESLMSKYTSWGYCIIHLLTVTRSYGLQSHMQSCTAEMNLWCNTFCCSNAVLDVDHYLCSVYHLPHITYSYLTTGGLLLTTGINSHSNEELPQSWPLSLLNARGIFLTLIFPPLERVKEETAGDRF